MIPMQIPGAYRLHFVATGAWRGPIKQMAKKMVTGLVPSLGDMVIDGFGENRVKVTIGARRKPRGRKTEAITVTRSTKKGTCMLVADVVGPLRPRQRAAVRAKGYALLRTLQQEYAAAKSAPPAAAAGSPL